ncbi:DUF4331 family protein [Nonomuraea typhae]|uniref:DUF4331 family protein n=1 Tax=Nonomuraea typhae TaxID=2603600 RepID=UPI0012FAAF6C|nr:DUF4331 family protein [Nonomuraea typhae]
MSHHLSGPNLRPPAEDARLDLTDLFAFQSPDRQGHTVLIMDVNSYGFDPSAGPHPYPGAVYRLSVDTDGDVRADVAFSFVFSEPDAGGGQTVTVYHAIGERADEHHAGGEVLLRDVPVSFGAEPNIVREGWLTLAVGLRSDPFFADLEGIGNNFTWTGNDTMARNNVISIALEMPDWILGESPQIGLWGRVVVERDGQWVSVDRGAHPSLTAYFNPEDAKDAYNAGEPIDDVVKYRDAWVKVLEHTGGYTPEEAAKALETVLPDVLRFDRSKPAGYPNGRRLDDDITDLRLQFISNGKIQGDGIGPHTDLLPGFPYTGPPHA